MELRDIPEERWPDITHKAKIFNTKETVYGVAGVPVGAKYNNEEYMTFRALRDDGYFSEVIVIKDTIQRNTGETDRNGTHVFEGDHFLYHVDDDILGTIRFGRYRNPGDSDKTAHVGFYVEWPGKYRHYLRSDLGYWLDNSKGWSEGSSGEKCEEGSV